MRAVNVEAQACNTSPWLKEEDREFETNLSYLKRLYFGGGRRAQKSGQLQSSTRILQSAQKKTEELKIPRLNQRPKSATWAGPAPFPAPRSLTRTQGSGGTKCGL